MAIIRDMVQALPNPVPISATALAVEEVLEDRGTGNGFDDFVGEAAGEGGVAEFQGVGVRVAAVGLGGGVCGGAGVDAPGGDTEGG